MCLQGGRMVKSAVVEDDRDWQSRGELTRAILLRLWKKKHKIVFS